MFLLIFRVLLPPFFRLLVFFAFFGGSKSVTSKRPVTSDLRLALPHPSGSGLQDTKPCVRALTVKHKDLY